MSQQKEIRQLAGIVFTDIVGFTHLMDGDESTAREILKRQRQLIHPIVKRHEGKVLKEMGDGYLLMFASVLNAVRCAIAIQQAEKEFTLRIGVHIGDVVMEDDDIYGTGVNVASRIENLAPPGGICISSDVWHQINNQVDLRIKSLGMKKLKGVSTPMEVYELYSSESVPSVDAESTQPLSTKKKTPFFNLSWMYSNYRWAAGISLLLFLLIGLYIYTPDQTAPSVPGNSIAVLPFENLSSDSGDVYFADGVHEDIIIHLSQIGDMRVIARSSVLPFQPGDRNLATIANDLNVSTVLEGSIRRAGDVVRVSVQLIDPHSNQTLWADVYEREIIDIFAIQSEISKQVATALQTHLTPEEIERMDTPPTYNFSAYDQFLRGNYYLARRTPTDVLRAIEFYRTASRLDPEFVEAQAREAYAYALFVDWGWSYPGSSHDVLINRGLELVDKILQDDPNSAEGWMSKAYLQVVADPYRMKGALNSFEKAIALNSNNSEAYYQYGQTLMILGQYEEAMSAYMRVFELEPDRTMTAISIAAIMASTGRNHEVINWLDKAVSLGSTLSYARAVRSHFLTHSGEVEKALEDAHLAVASDEKPSVPALSALAAALAMRGDQVAADAEIDRAYATLSNPDHPNPTEFFGLAHALLILEREEDVVELLERTTPRGAWLWFYAQLPYLKPLLLKPSTRRIIDEANPRKPPD